MKVFILNPPIYSKKNSIMNVRPRPPLSLAYLASLLFRDGYEVKLIDASILKYDVNQTLKEIKDYCPDILILTSTPVDRWECPNSHIDSIFYIINQANIKQTILTGAHGSLTPEWIFKKCNVQFIVKGEPEIVTLNLVTALCHNGDIKTVKGISYRINGQIIHNEVAVRIDDLDKLPLPAYHLLPMDQYQYGFIDLSNPFFTVLTSRGCPFNCIFCLKIMSKGKYVARSPENVVMEIEYLIKNFNIKSIFFQDWEFILNQERVEKICQLILNRGLKFYWGCNGRVENISDDLIKKMKTAGCVRINIGFESGSQKILNKANKNIQITDLEQAIKICRANNIIIGMCAMLNLPGENKETIKETINFFVKNKIESMVPNLAIPYFGTALFEKMEHFKKRVSWDNIEKYAGRIDVAFSPRRARLLFRYFKWQAKFGKYFWLTLSFYKYFWQLIKKKL